MNEEDLNTQISNLSQADSANKQPINPTIATKVADGSTPNYLGNRSGETQNLAGVPAEFMGLFEHDPSEVILYQALRHPAGVYFIYGAGIGAVILIVLLMGVIASDTSGTFGTGLSSNFFSVMVLVGILFIAITAGVSLAAAYIYKKSRMILTNQKLVFIQYHSIFSREVSQLNIGDVEDVNVAQKTIWDRILKTGNITIETSGEQNNNVMSHVQDPHGFAQKAIRAHEGLIAEYGN